MGASSPYKGAMKEDQTKRRDIALVYYFLFLLVLVLSIFTILGRKTHRITYIGIGMHRVSSGFSTNRPAEYSALQILGRVLGDQY